MTLAYSLHMCNTEWCTAELLLVHIVRRLGTISSVAIVEG